MLDTTPADGALRVAVAEDNEAMGLWFEKALPTLGHRLLFVAGSGEELVEKARAASPDLVISDIRLPGMDGIAACEQVYRERPVPVILVSAYFEPETIARAEHSHALAYLVKPIETHDLGPAIALALRRFRQAEQLRREAEEARRALEERKLVERAKGIVAKRLRVEEAEAYRRLQKLASCHNHKLFAVAQSVIAADEPFAALEKSHG